jgi:hypothetical protein
MPPAATKKSKQIPKNSTVHDIRFFAFALGIGGGVHEVGGAEFWKLF